MTLDIRKRRLFHLFVRNHAIWSGTRTQDQTMRKMNCNTLPNDGFICFFKVLISCCQGAKQAGSIVVCAGYFFSTLQVFVGIADWLCFNQTVDNLSKFIRSHMCIMSSLALIMSLCPGRDLLIGHGRCTSCVQRHLAAVAVRREGIDLGSLLCMRKTIPDLGLVVWAAWQRMCSTVNANEKDEHNTEGATWNTESLCSLI